MFYTPYVHSVVRLQGHIARNKWQLTFASISYADIVESRNSLLTHWYDKTDATHLLFVDADMGYDPQAVVDMVRLDRPLVGAIYPKRQIDLDRMAKLAAEGTPPERARAQALEFIVRRNAKSRLIDRQGFISVDACGTGLLLIRRDCVATMLQKMPQLSDPHAPKHSPFARSLTRLIRAFDPVTVDGARLSEDFSFCHRWRQSGGEIWASATHAITHVGLQRFTGRYRDASGPRIRVGRLPGASAAGAAPRIVARERGGPKARKPAAKPLDDSEPATADEMTLAFLRGQIDSPRWGRHYLTFLHRHGLDRAALIDCADLSDAEQNRQRALLAARASGFLFRGFPSDVTWTRGTFAPAHFDRLKYMKCEPWLTLSGGTRSVIDGAANLGRVRLTKGAEARRTSENILAIAEKVRGGARHADLIAGRGRRRSRSARGPRAGDRLPGRPDCRADRHFRRLVAGDEEMGVLLRRRRASATSVKAAINKAAPSRATREGATETGP